MEGGQNMQFGICVATKIDDWQLIKYAEDLGYDRAWVPDSQMIWSDCYATLALAAQNTSRIRLGTGVAIPGTRIAPVTAHSIASINRIAPGRVFLGVGTGHTAMRVMGLGPMKIRDFREYLRVVRTLLQGEEVEYTYKGETREIRFLHLDLGFINVSDPIPIYVAGNNPRVLRVAGEYGDGLVFFGDPPNALRTYYLRLAQEGAEKAGRAFPADFHTATFTTVVVLRPGEPANSERVIDECGAMVACIIHYVYEIYKQTRNEEVVPPHLKSIWEEYCSYVDKMETPQEKRYQQIHNGHCTFLMPEERRFMTPEAIKGSCLVGEPDEIIDQVRKAEKAGLKEMTLLPPMASARKVFKDFAEQVMARC
jgi:alkanesulfonate monooxygenase SsuD/methylene tetrahydromethanopterin reductase-like flavin-dependent oxidoreductase (luciferase family)